MSITILGSGRSEVTLNLDGIDYLNSLGTDGPHEMWITSECGARVLWGWFTREHGGWLWHDAAFVLEERLDEHAL